MNEKQNDGLQLILSAAKAHGEGSEPEHEVGDLQDVLRCAWALMTPMQRVSLLRSREVDDLVENELPQSKDGSSAEEQLDAAVQAEIHALSVQQQASAALQSRLAELVTKHPGLGASDWQATCNGQGWNEESQVVHLEGFIGEMGLMPAFAAYASQAAAEENGECEAAG